MPDLTVEAAAVVPLLSALAGAAARLGPGLLLRVCLATFRTSADGMPLAPLEVAEPGLHLTLAEARVQTVPEPHDRAEVQTVPDASDS